MKSSSSLVVTCQLPWIRSFVRMNELSRIEGSAFTLCTATVLLLERVQTASGWSKASYWTTDQVLRSMRGIRFVPQSECARGGPAVRDNSKVIPTTTVDGHAREGDGKAVVPSFRVVFIGVRS